MISALVLALSHLHCGKQNQQHQFHSCFLWHLPLRMMVAADKGKLRYLLLSAVLLSVACNAKTLEAFLILPGLFVAYFFATNIKWHKRVIHLAIAAAVLAAVSLSWSITVDLPPASERPYVDSSSTNSELVLLLGYNGIQHITGQSNGKGGGMGVQRKWHVQRRRKYQHHPHVQLHPWLLPLVFFSILAFLLGICKSAEKDSETRKKRLRSLLVFGTSFFIMFAYFSVSSFFHAYYISVMYLFLVAWVGIGIAEMWKLYRSKGIVSFLLPVAFAVTTVVQIILLTAYPSYAKVLIPLLSRLQVCSLRLLSGPSIPWPAIALIRPTGKPVMAIDGFSGNDSILTIAKLQQMIKANGAIFSASKYSNSASFDTSSSTSSNDTTSFFRMGNESSSTVIYDLSAYKNK